MSKEGLEEFGGKGARKRSGVEKKAMTGGPSDGKAPKAKKAKRAAPTDGNAEQQSPAPKRRGRKPKAENAPKPTARERFIATALKKVGLSELPPLKQLVRGLNGTPTKIRDIAVFIGGEPPSIGSKAEREAVGELFHELPTRNVVNLSAGVIPKGVKNAAVAILEAGRAWMDIYVANLSDGPKNLQCWSGRHRLAFFALAYGPDAEVPVNLQTMNLQEARDATVYANQTRSVQTLEKAEHRAMRAVDGAEVKGENIDHLYERMAGSKAGAVDYCIFLIFDTATKGTKLKFRVAKARSRTTATVDGIKGYLKAAIEWRKEMSRSECDKELRGAVAFLNALMDELNGLEGFDPAQHLASMPLGAVGKMYVRFTTADNNEPSDYALVTAQALVELGDIGRKKAGELEPMLAAKVKEKIRQAD